MDISTVIMMLLIGVFGGFISGLVGIGGAIIIYPAILLLPPLFGVLHTAHTSLQDLLPVKSFQYFAGH